ncbi:MAG: hypothetical protein NTZ29_09555 [Verrucomicrobia bacterium]|nr:hypothetical protein [Verrucomicrobiota bacterium]
MFAGSFNAHVLSGQLDELIAGVSTEMIRSGGNAVVRWGSIGLLLTETANVKPAFSVPVIATRDAALVIACLQRATFCSLRSCPRTGDFLRGYDAWDELVAALLYTAA